MKSQENDHKEKCLPQENQIQIIKTYLWLNEGKLCLLDNVFHSFNVQLRHGITLVFTAMFHFLSNLEPNFDLIEIIIIVIKIMIINQEEE